MMRFVVQVANDPARRFRLLWNLVSWGIAGLYMVIGAGYAVGGEHAIQSQTLGLLMNLENPIGGLHAHGFILMATALWLAYGLGEFRQVTRHALQFTAFYSLLTSILIFGNWAFIKITFGAPWWYVFVSFLSIVLLVFSPPLNDAGRLFDGSERA